MTDTQISNDLLRAIMNMRETRRDYLNWKSVCAEKKREGLAPRQYEQELKDLNDSKALFFQSVQNVLTEGDKEIARQKALAECPDQEVGKLVDTLINEVLHADKPLLITSPHVRKIQTARTALIEHVAGKGTQA